MFLKRLLPERHLIVPLIVAVGWFMEHLDSTILATALPTISRSLHEDPIQLNLAITSYLISLAVFLPVSGWVADRFGPRLVFQVALLIFGVSSIACGLSNTLLELVAGRVAQGLGGAMMVPVGRLLVLRSVPKSDMVRAMAYLTMPAMLGPILGPPVGGFIVTYASWRWIFFINLPVGLLGVLLTALFIPNKREANVTPFDGKGSVLSGIGLAGLVFGFEVGSRHAVPYWMSGAMVGAGALCTLLYVFHARRCANPIVDFSLYRIPTMRAAIVGGSLVRIGVGATPFLLPLLLQIGFGLDAFHSGLMTFASAIGSFFLRPAARPIFRRFGFRPVMIANTLLCTAFMVVNAFFRPNTSAVLIYLCLFSGGFCRSLQFTAVSILGYAEVPSARMSKATSLNSIVTQVSISLGVGIAAMLLQFSIHLRGDTQLAIPDFSFAFIAISAISVCGMFSFLRLPQGAGDELSGHHSRHGAAEEKDDQALVPDAPAKQPV